MPAEKLTKKRLIQIIVVLLILLSAFFYRTFEHQKNTPNDSKDKVEQVSLPQ